MKIGIDSRLWNETGVGRYIKNLVKHLLLFDEKNDYVLFVLPRDSRNLKSQILNFKSGVSVKIVETDIRWHSIKEQLLFPSLIYEQKVDLMHFTYFSVPVFYKRPFVLTVHDLIINHFPTGRASTLPAPFYRLKHLGYKFVMTYGIENAMKIIAPLEAVKEDIISFYRCDEDRIRVTLEGVDDNFDREIKNMMKPAEERYFLYVGNFYPHKNCEKLIDAFGLFRKEHGDARLVMAGKKDYFYERLVRKVREEKIDGVIFKSDLDDNELSGYYANAIGFVSASLMEGFGLSPLEAASMGCPVVLSDIPAFREIWGKTAIYFDPNDKNDIKSKLSFVYNLDKKSRSDRIAEVFERSRKFSWRLMAEATLDVYENCVGV